MFYTGFRHYLLLFLRKNPVVRSLSIGCIDVHKSETFRSLDGPDFYGRRFDHDLWFQREHPQIQRLPLRDDAFSTQENTR